MNMKTLLIFITVCIPTVIAPIATTTHAKSNCKKTAQVPYLKELKATNIPMSLKKPMMQAWAHVYATYLAKSATTKKNSKEWLSLKKKAYIGNDFCKYTPLGQPTEQIEQFKICLDAPTTSETANVTACHNNLQAAYNALTHNYLVDLHSYLSPTDFPKLPKDENQYKHNYATHHLNRTVGRLAQVNKISTDNFEPKVSFTGDVRDLGTIVNITNHTNKQFAIAQTSNSKDTFIGTVGYGNNGVNLHTAALQHPQAKSDETLSIDRFTFYPIEPTSDRPMGTPLFTIRMYTGAEIKKFLKTLPHDKEKNTFLMNGQPTSPEHLAEDKDWYMLIVQNPTPQGQSKPNPDQRIQAINISALQHPFLLSIEINELIETEINQTTQNTTTKILQPSFSTVQTLQPLSSDMPALPLIILPDYLEQNSVLQTYWMMFATTYIAAATDFSFFGNDTFGSAFDYYKGLGYFETKHEARFMIDKYNLLPTGKKLSDAPRLIESALYATNLDTCLDIPQLYVYQDATGKMISNVNDGYHINFQAIFAPKSKQKPTKKLFKKLGFNGTYSLPYHQLYTLFFGLPTDSMKKGVFANFSQPKKNLYKLSWTNRANQLLSSKTLFLDYPINNMHIKFIDNNPNSEGSTIPQDLISNKVKQSKNFKVTYSHNGTKHKLTAKPVSALDKTRTIHTVEFSKYPLKELYFDVYKVFKASPYTRCYMFKNGNLPKFLTKLTTQDWEDGILLVPTIKNNKALSKKNPGELTVTFYKSDQETVLGTITTRGTFNNTAMTGIQEPVTLYNLGGKNIITQYQILSSTSILIKYKR